MNKPNPIPKVAALILITLGVTFLTIAFDASQLAKLDSMSAAEVVQHQRNLHHHSFIFHFISWLIVGGFYLGMIEFLTCVIGLAFTKKANA